MKGRKPVPTHLRVIRGNPGKRALNGNEPLPVGDLVDPPEWMTEEYTKIQIQRQENLTCAIQDRLASAGEKQNAAVPVPLADCGRGKDSAGGASIHESQLATKLVQ